MNKCCICYNKKSIINFSCNHFVCIFCIVKMNKLKCPYCRKSLKDDIPIEIKNIISKNTKNKDKTINDYYYNWNYVNISHIPYKQYMELTKFT